MMHPSFKDRLLWLIIVSIGVVVTMMLTGLTIQAQGGYPEFTDLYINDYANLLTAEDANNVRQLLTGLKQDKNIEATVVTIASLSDYSTGDETIESFATNLFNTWGVGDAERNNGVLFLVAAGDRKVRIELGSGYESASNAIMQEVINEHVLPSFRQNNYSQGIYRGVRAIVGELTGDWPPDLSSSTSSTAQTAPQAATPIPISSSSSISTRSNTLPDIHPLAFLGGGVATIGAAGFGLRQYFRYRKRRCPDCQTYMVRLDESADDAYLDEGQRLEEVLKSVDYDVWQCPNCNTQSLHNYRNWFSSLDQCPRCHYRTVRVTSRTLVEPTYSSSGSKRITKDCQHCSYHDEETVTIPQKTRSSSSSSSSSSSRSSSGSSFGGGSSSGGGASGSW